VGQGEEPQYTQIAGRDDLFAAGGKGERGGRLEPIRGNQPTLESIDIASCSSSHSSAKDSQLNGTHTIIRQLQQLASGVDRALTAMRSLTDQDSRAVAATTSGRARTEATPHIGSRAEAHRRRGAKAVGGSARGARGG
jgi:hypothetical protein